MTNIMKRCICILMAVTLCFGLAIGVRADETGAQMTDEQKDALEVLRLLGIFSNSYDYNTTLDENVTRADFANVAARLINADSYSGSSMYYYDVPNTHYAFEAISTLTEMGVINGTGDKLFEPETPLDSGAAYKILLSLMGYDARAEADGGYPTGYIKTANRLDMYVGTADSECMTRGDMLVVVYRAMKTQMFEPTSFTNEGTSMYEVSDNDTLLSVYHDIYYGKGVVNGAKMTTINGMQLNEENEVLIESVICTSDVDLSGMLGEEAEIFARYDKVTEKANVLWAKSTGSADVLNVAEDDVVGFNDDSFAFSYADSKENIKQITLDRTIRVIYNGREVETNTDEIFELPRYSVKFVKSDGKWTLAVVENYVNYVAGVVNTEDLMIYDMNQRQTGLSLDKNDYDYLSIETAGGAVLSVGDIKLGNVLSVYTSQDGRYRRVIVSTGLASGTLEGTRNTDRGTVLTVAGAEYVIPSDVSVVVPAVGSNVTLYIDFDGNVVYVGTLTGDYFVGYITKAVTRDDAFSEVLAIKILTDKGDVKTYDCAEKVTVDGEQMTTVDEVMSALGENGEFKSQLALVGTNKDGEINNIDTAYVRPGAEDIRNTLSRDFEKQSLMYRWTGFFGAKAVINANTVVFRIPTEENPSDNDYSITVGNKGFVDWKSYIIESYKVSDRQGYSKWIVMDAVVGETFESIPVIVSEVVSVMDEDGAVVEAIEGYQGSSKVTYYASDGYSFSGNGIEKGMLIQVKLDLHKKVTESQVVFDIAKKGTYNTGNQLNLTNGVVIGYVNDVVGDVMHIGYTDPSAKDYIVQKHTAPVVVYEENDRGEAKITVGSFEDARTYYNSGTDCSSVILCSTQGVPQAFIIYR